MWENEHATFGVAPGQKKKKPRRLNIETTIIIIIVYFDQHYKRPFYRLSVRRCVLRRNGPSDSSQGTAEQNAITRRRWSCLKVVAVKTLVSSLQRFSNVLLSTTDYRILLRCNPLNQVFPQKNIVGLHTPLLYFDVEQGSETSYTSLFIEVASKM